MFGYIFRINNNLLKVYEICFDLKQMIVENEMSGHSGVVNPITRF